MQADRNQKIRRRDEPHSAWLCDRISALKEEFSEANILRLTKVKPAKVSNLSQARKLSFAIEKLRYYACFPGGVIRRYGREIVVDKGTGKGWVEFAECYKVYITTSAKVAKLDLLFEDMEERVMHLEDERRQKDEVLRRSKEAAKQFAKAGQDEKLAGALWHALEAAPPTPGFVYLKRWVMPDASCWFKVGITNNPDRRETEQNVLPVAAETIACVDVGSMDRARAIEATIHQVLEEQRITDANNRELFHLNGQQASAVKAVLEKLK
jgi:hypothetical protein